MIDKSDNKEYKESLKATSLFGGVQIFNILISIVRSKFVAILLGPTGIGIIGLYTSATSLINTVSGLGLNTSAVRDISQAHVSGDKRRIQLIISVFRKLVWITGVVGALICLTTSHYLSQISFGNSDYTVGFAILSISLLFQQLTTGQTTLLQGLHRFSYMAKANVLGSLVGLFVTVPLYYIWSFKAIVPVILLTGIMNMFFAYYYSNKIDIKPIKVTPKQIKREGRPMVILGISFSVSSLLTVAAAYVIRVYISNYGSIADVGLFTAGFTIVNTSVGMVLNSMGTAYFPMLAEAANDDNKFTTLINNQIEIGLLFLVPIIVAFIIFAHIAVYILYSTKFYPVEKMMYFVMFGVFFKVISWAMSFTFGAKGDAKVFLFNEILSNIYCLLLNIICYNLWGLTGLGVSFVIGYFLYMIQNFIIVVYRYKFRISNNNVKLILLEIPFTIICLLLSMFASNIVKYSIGSVLIIITTYISFLKLNKHMNLKELIIKKIRNE